MSNVINLPATATVVAADPAQITQGGYGPHRIVVFDGADGVQAKYPTSGPASRETCEHMVRTWTAAGTLAPGWKAKVVPVLDEAPSLLDALPELVRS